MKRKWYTKREEHGIKYTDYIRAIEATTSKTVLNKIIYFCGYDKELNESEVKAVITLASEKLGRINRAKRNELARMNNRSIAKIEA